MKKTYLKVLFFVSLVVVFILLLRSPLLKQLSLESIKENLEYLQNQFREYPIRSMLLYLLIYTVVAGLSLPGAVPLTLAGGAIFGLVWGTFAVSIGSTLGATFAFLGSRFLFSKIVYRMFGERIHAINEGFNKEGWNYLLALRLIPLFPYFLVNIGMGLTSMRTWTYMWVSQIGMLPASVVYVNAGMEISKIESLQGIFSPELILSFTLIGLLPFITKSFVHRIHSLKVYKPFTKPKTFDYNVIVIGAGAAGLISSYVSAASKAKVALIEKDKMGGECLYRGCVPSKALIKAAHIANDAKKAEQFGFTPFSMEFDFRKIMESVQDVIKRVAPHDSPERYTRLGVDCINGEAQIKSPWEVLVGSKTYTTRSIIVASGARPRIPHIPGLDQVPYWTSDTIWNLRELPKKFLVLGGGPIACELGQCFARFGSEVTIVQGPSHLLHREDEDVGSFLQHHFEKEGIRVLTHCKALEFRNDTLSCAHNHKQLLLPFDHVFVAVGRTPNIENLGLEKLGINLNAHALESDPYLRTRFPNIYACGDVVGPYRFTHLASYQAFYCAMNALFGQIWKLKPSYKAVPWCTFTSPEIASVGYNEAYCKKHRISYNLTKYDLSELDRAIADRENYGFVKVLTSKTGNRILGATIVAPRAGEMITEFVSAIQHNLSLSKIMQAIHIYPTYSEANKATAGEWSKQKISPTLLRFLSRYHTWRRS